MFLLFVNLCIAQTNDSIESTKNFQPITDSTIIKANIELKEVFKPFANVEKYGLGILKYNATSGYSTTGATFKIYNPSRKTIKYIWFTIAGENPVKDLVKSGGVFYKTLRGIGPVEPYNTGEWSFDYVWLTDIVEYIKIATIKVQYMDGTTKTIKYNNKMFIGEEAYNKVLHIVNKKNEYEEFKEKKVVHDYDQNIFTIVDQSAEFPGGTTGFTQKLKSELRAGLIGKVKISFIIEKDGSMIDILAFSENDELSDEIRSTLRRLRLKWSPAKINNNVVRQKMEVQLLVD